MAVRAGNLGEGLPAPPIDGELTETLCHLPGLRIERIVSTGQATPDGEWYDQDSDEWVLLVAGTARLLIDGEDRSASLPPEIGSCYRLTVGIASPGPSAIRRRFGSPSMSPSIRPKSGGAHQAGGVRHLPVRHTGEKPVSSATRAVLSLWIPAYAGMTPVSRDDAVTTRRIGLIRKTAPAPTKSLQHSPK